MGNPIEFSFSDKRLAFSCGLAVNTLILFMNDGSKSKIDFNFAANSVG